ncbi:MAG TPA: hypothetical protein VL981_06830 [Candidatus Methylacidiphilales bacterium]|nr:hypothetical protein [Candidatus Methylacidiphilales bacterium]
MQFLHVILTHVAPPQVDEFLTFCDRVTPGIPRLLAYGGPSENFSLLAHPAKIFLADESLRGPVIRQCLNEILPKVSAYLNSPASPQCELVHFSEFDHLILCRNYFDKLAEIFRQSGCDLIGKTAGPKTHSNWVHYLRYREDEPLRNYLARISKREDKRALYGMLGNGYTLSRNLVDSIAGLSDLPRVYYELLFPTLAHHLGFEVGDLGAFSDIFCHVRWGPAWKLEEVGNMIKRGAVCCHPFKDLDRLPVVSQWMHPKSAVE